MSALRPRLGELIAWAVLLFGTAGALASGTAKLHVGLPVLSVSPHSLAFGPQSMGTTSAPQEITVTAFSIFPGTLVFPWATVSSPDFSVDSSNCAGLTAPNSCVLRVFHHPRPTPGALNADVATSGTLHVSWSGCGNIYYDCHAIPLSGIAQRSLTMHYYASILRRAPDAGGKAFWEGEVIRVAVAGVKLEEAWFAMAKAFFNSGEYLGRNAVDADFVTDLYRTFLVRSPDAAGAAFWTGQLASGLPREVALAAFMFSAEFGEFSRTLFGTGTSRAEIESVTDFYRGILARLPDAGGLANWVQRFREAQCSGPAAVLAEVESISRSFVDGPEYVARARGDADFVGDMYNAFLRRGGDLAGVQFWVNRLATGTSRDQLRKEFLVSPEFSARVAAIVAQGCQL